MKGFSKALGKFKEGDYGGALKSVQQQVKQVALDLTDLEMVVEEATNSEPWGPHGKLLARIASEAGQSEEKFREIMGVLVDRISAAWRKPKQWRWAYKSLLVLDFIIKNGPEQVARELSDDESMDIFNGLAKFRYVEENTLKDFGVNVRKRATDIAALLNDPERLAEERATAAKSKSKLGGMGRKDTYSGGFSSASPTTLYETENTAGWGKQRSFASGPTLVRTKPSFSVPEPLRIRDEVEPTKASASPVSADILGLGTPGEDPPSGPSGLTPPPKGEESEGASNRDERAPPTHQQHKGKPKLLSETKVNPKMRLSLKGFKNPPTSASTQQTPAMGAGGGAGTLDADLMSLSAPVAPQALGGPASLMMPPPQQQQGPPTMMAQPGMMPMPMGQPGMMPQMMMQGQMPHTMVPQMPQQMAQMQQMMMQQPQQMFAHQPPQGNNGMMAPPQGGMMQQRGPPPPTTTMAATTAAKDSTPSKDLFADLLG